MRHVGQVGDFGVVGCLFGGIFGGVWVEGRREQAQRA